MFTIEKNYVDLPFSHRQPRHDGHCQYVHGHNVTFKILFCSNELDENGFVVDFGKLKPIKDFIYKMFDHTLVIEKTDPYLEVWKKLNDMNLCDLRIVDSVSAEGLSCYVRDEVNKIVEEMTDGRVAVLSVTVFEDSHNSATSLQNLN